MDPMTIEIIFFLSLAVFMFLVGFNFGKATAYDEAAARHILERIPKHIPPSAPEKPHLRLVE